MHPTNTLVDTGASSKQNRLAGWQVFLDPWTDNQMPDTVDDELYVGSWQWKLIQPWHTAVNPRYALSVSVVAKEGLDPPLIGMQFDLNLPLINADSLFDRDHSFSKNCSGNDTSVDCRINVFTKLSGGESYLNDFSVLLPVDFGDDFDWGYSYRMLEWMGEYITSSLLDMKTLSPFPDMRGIDGFPFPKNQTNK